MVTGRLAQRSWETQQGERRTSYEVTADEVGQMLTAPKVNRSTGGGGDDPWASPAPSNYPDEPPF